MKVVQFVTTLCEESLQRPLIILFGTSKDFIFCPFPIGAFPYFSFISLCMTEKLYENKCVGNRVQCSHTENVSNLQLCRVCHLQSIASMTAKHFPIAPPGVVSLFDISDWKVHNRMAGGGSGSPYCDPWWWENYLTQTPSCR